MINYDDFEPTEDRVLIERVPPEEATEGGIVLPDQARQDGELTFGRVLKVGPGKAHWHTDGCTRRGIPLVAGDIICTRTGLMLRILKFRENGKHLGIVDYEDCFGVLRVDRKDSADGKVS